LQTEMGCDEKSAAIFQGGSRPFCLGGQLSPSKTVWGNSKRWSLNCLRTGGKQTLSAEQKPGQKTLGGRQNKKEGQENP